MANNTETVLWRLPSGEEIEAVVPAGLSDAAIRVYTLSKRPDLFAKLGRPLPGLAQPANAPLPQLSPSEEMPLSQASEDAQGNVGQTLGELGGPALAGLSIAGTGAAILPSAIRATPAAIQAIKLAGEAHPIVKELLKTGIKYGVGGAAFHEGQKIMKALGWFD